MSPPSLPLLFLLHACGADKRTVLGSDKPCEGVTTSLRFPSQPGSFSPGNYASEASSQDGQPDSPIKTSPVSERIKALEALAAKKREPDFRSDGGYSHFRERHHEKSPTENPKLPTELRKPPAEMARQPPAKTAAPNQIPKHPVEKITPATQKRECSADLESPESPFEILGDLRQVNEFEETEEWMRTHLPPVPDFGSVGLTKGPDGVPLKEKEPDIAVPDASAAFAGVPDAFMDSPGEAAKPQNDQFDDVQKQPSVEEEFDLSFLPTAYVWDQQEKLSVQASTNPDSLTSSSPAPPVGFDSPSPRVLSPADTDEKLNVSKDEKTSWSTDVELPEAGEADSSGESDDTVIEDGVGTPAPAPDPAVSDDPTVEKETPPPKSERKLMQVPTINVIETDEPNHSDEEMEMEPEAEEDDGYEVVQDPYGEMPKTSESEDDKTEPLKTRPLETEFMEGYSPPSSPVDSGNEYSPKHKILKSSPETVPQESQPKPAAPASSGICEDPESDNQQTTKKTTKELSTFPIMDEDEDSPDNDDEWSDEARNILVESYQKDVTKEAAIPASKTNFMQDDIYGRESFDYDYDASSPFDIDNKGLSNAKERFLSDPVGLEQRDGVQDGHSLDKATSLNDDEGFSAESHQPEYPQDPYSCFQNKKPSSAIDGTSDNKINTSKVQQDSKTTHHSFDEMAKPEGDRDSEPTDSFVDFMRECLKSRQDEGPEGPQQGGSPQKKEMTRPSLTPPQPPPSMVMNLEQEQLTITALKQLGSSQEEEEVNRRSSNPSSETRQSSGTAVPNCPCVQSSSVSDNAYSKEVEAIDEWVAEAYHLAEHVLTAILTHLSGNASSF